MLGVLDLIITVLLFIVCTVLGYIVGRTFEQTALYREIDKLNAEIWKLKREIKKLKGE